MGKSKGPISKVNVVEIFGDPLQELIDICGSITVPDPHEFKKMLQNYQVVVDGKLWYSIFAGEWPDFYNLPNLLENITNKYAATDPQLSKLCSQILDVINDCQESIVATVESTPEHENISSIEIDESFYDLMVSKLHKRLKGICIKLNKYYLPKLFDACDPLITKKALNQPIKEDHETLLSERQLEIWDLLKGRSLVAKELGDKLELSDVNIRKHIQKIRKKRGKECIKTQRGRGYWRPDAPPPGYKEIKT
jgi:biotin operon repressor